MIGLFMAAAAGCWIMVFHPEWITNHWAHWFGIK